MTLAVIVDLQDLLSTVIASVIAGIGITVIFSVAIWGAARFVELSREERIVAATGAAGVGLLALAMTLAMVVVGLIVMTSG